MIVYLLKITVKYRDDRMFGIRRSDDWYYCDVFTNLKQAVSVGKGQLTEHLRELREDLPDSHSCARDAPLSVFVEESKEDHNLLYDFSITEFDPDVKRDSSGRWEYFIKWEYDILGHLITRYECDTYERLPGDEAKDAGTKFPLGSFVTAEVEKYKDQVFVVTFQPGRRSESEHPEGWENIYTLESFRRASWFHEHFHETKLRLYDKEVPQDHPLQLLRRIATGELKISEETWMEMAYGSGKRAILLDYPPECEFLSWRDIPEFRP
jgi:hypothetical protein